MIEKFFCCGISHHNTPIEIREQFYVSAEKIPQLSKSIRDRFGLDEIIIVSTCNRLEVYGTDPNCSQQDRSHFTKIISHILHSNHPDAKHSEVDSFVYVEKGEAGIFQLINMVSSMDSLVVGETQITGQFKSALSLAQENGLIGTMLSKAADTALNAAKKIRTETDISKKPVSIAHAAIDLSKNIFEHLNTKYFLVIGAGEMARLCCQYIARYQAKHIAIANRSHSNAEKLSATIPNSSAYALSELPRLLEKADIVISATGFEHYLLTVNNCKKALTSRKQRNIYMVDIALPRDIDPAIGEFENAFIFDIDDLKSIVEKSSEERQKAKESGQVIAQAAINNYKKWLAGHKQAGKASDVTSQLKGILEAELEKTLSKEDMRGLTDQQKKHLARLMQSIHKKISHLMIKKTKE